MPVQKSKVKCWNFFFFPKKKATMISNKEEKKKKKPNGFLKKLCRNAYLSGYALNMKAIC